MCRNSALRVDASPSGTRFLAGYLLACSLCVGCADKIQLPSDLAGTYVTSDPAYADRYIGLSPDTIVLGLGSGKAENHPIEAVYRGREKSLTFYTVVYHTSSGDDRLTFYREQEGIVLRSRPTVHWLKGEPKP